jgi:hypothetical protein
LKYDEIKAAADFRLNVFGANLLFVIGLDGLSTTGNVRRYCAEISNFGGLIPHQAIVLRIDVE